jgi:hypothetical protein
MSMAHEKAQAVMNKAFEKWTPNLRFEEFMQELNRNERLVVAIGTLNYQVENGGFSQWMYNGYATDPNTTFWALRTLGSPEADRVAELVQKALQNEDEDWSEYEDDDEDGGVLDALDREFYKLNSRILDQLEAKL